MATKKKKLKKKIKRRKLYKRILSDLREKEQLAKGPNVYTGNSLEFNLGVIENKIKYYKNQLNRI